MRSLADALALALKPKKVAINHTRLLTKGVKSGAISPRKEQPKISPMRGPAPKAKPYLGEIKVDVNLPNSDQSPEYREGIRRVMVGIPNAAPADVVKYARIAQGIKSQSAGVEDHMNLQPPVRSKYPPVVPTPDPYLERALTRDFITERKVDVNLKLKRLREETALRKRIQQLVNEGIVE